MTPPFRRVLVANRGEIALRIIRAAHELGMEAVAVYSDVDATARHVREADVGVRLGPAPATESYLRGEAIVTAALRTGADAIHPGYGFLAERAAFARQVIDAGITWVGPSPESIAAVGDKLAARRLAAASGVPVVPGTLEPASVDGAGSAADLMRAAAEIGFPLLVKAAAGGGGRGMRRVEAETGLADALVAASREAAASFGDGAVYLEREVRPARHVEVQLLGDSTGDVVAIGERDCSIQRRHQKLVEEAPAPGLDRAERRRLHALAVDIGRAASLSTAATCEFLFDGERQFWFLEVNTRLQVEHPVSELVSGLDLVAEQFRLAAGRPLSDVTRMAAAAAEDPRGHAIEVRIVAEDPARAFAPVPGRITRWQLPAGPGVRVDTAIDAGDTVPPDYDPLIAKLIVHANDRDAARRRLLRAIDETEIGGIQTTLPFLRFVTQHAAFEASGLSTDWVADHWDGPAARSGALGTAMLAAASSVIEDPEGWGIAQRSGNATVRRSASDVPAAAMDGQREAGQRGRVDLPRPASTRWRDAGRAVRDWDR